MDGGLLTIPVAASYKTIFELLISTLAGVVTGKFINASTSFSAIEFVGHKTNKSCVHKKRMVNFFPNVMAVDGGLSTVDRSCPASYETIFELLIKENIQVINNVFSNCKFYKIFCTVAVVILL